MYACCNTLFCAPAVRNIHEYIWYTRFALRMSSTFGHIAPSLLMKVGGERSLEMLARVLRVLSTRYSAFHARKLREKFYIYCPPLCESSSVAHSRSQKNASKNKNNNQKLSAYCTSSDAHLILVPLFHVSPVRPHNISPHIRIGGSAPLLSFKYSQPGGVASSGVAWRD